MKSRELTYQAGGEETLLVPYTRDIRLRQLQWSRVRQTFPGEWKLLDWAISKCEDCGGPLAGAVWLDYHGREVALEGDHLLCPACGAVHALTSTLSGEWTAHSTGLYLQVSGLAFLRTQLDPDLRSWP